MFEISKMYLDSKLYENVNKTKTSFLLDKNENVSKFLFTLGIFIRKLEDLLLNKYVYLEQIYNSKIFSID